MKQTKFLASLLAILMLLPCVCLSSCSSPGEDVDKAFDNLKYCNEKYGTRYFVMPRYPTKQPQIDCEYEIMGPNYRIIVFNDVESARIYKEMAENDIQLQIIQYKASVAYAKEQRDVCTNLDSWSNQDKMLRALKRTLEGYEDTRVIRKGKVVYIGDSDFHDALNRKAGSSDKWHEFTAGLTDSADDIRYQFMGLYFNLLPSELLSEIYYDSQDFKGYREEEEFFTKVDDLDIDILEDVGITPYPSEKYSKIAFRYADERKKLQKEKCKLEIKYYEHVLDEYGGNMTINERAYLEQQLSYNEVRLEELKSISIYLRSGSLLFYGEFFPTVIAWVVNIFCV